MIGQKKREGLHDVKKPVKIFDCTLKKLIHNCESQTEAANYLGLTATHVAEIIKFKRKNRSNKLGLIITCR